jgi:hypothetical protein
MDKDATIMRVGVGTSPRIFDHVLISALAHLALTGIKAEIFMIW